VTNSRNINHASRVVDAVNDPVIADTDSPKIPIALKLN